MLYGNQSVGWRDSGEYHDHNPHVIDHVPIQVGKASGPSWITVPKGTLGRRHFDRRFERPARDERGRAPRASIQRHPKKEWRISSPLALGSWAYEEYACVGTGGGPMMGDHGQRDCPTCKNCGSCKDHISRLSCPTCRGWGYLVRGVALKQPYPGWRESP